MASQENSCLAESFKTMIKRIGEQEQNSKIQFFGIPLDPTDDPLKMEFKLLLAKDCASKKLRFKSPYSGVRSYLKDLFDAGDFKDKGEMKVPSWLTPVPSMEDLAFLTPLRNVTFIDSNGCYKYAERVKEFMKGSIGKGVPAMVAVDHSMTGGMLKALAERYSPENITVLILDSHFDAFSISERVELFRFAEKKYPDLMSYSDSRFFSSGADIEKSIPKTYNCGTFLKYLLEEEIIPPERLIVLGVSDYPTEEMRRERGIRRYTEQYLQFEREGVTFVTKEEIERIGIERIMTSLLGEVKTDYIYISFDADIGALNAIYAARFLNCIGLNKRQIYEIADTLVKALQKDLILIGLDICEIEIFLAGLRLTNGIIDDSLEVLSDFVRVLLGYQPKFI